MNAAPYLRQERVSVNARTHTELGAVYDKWREHYNNCVTCQRDEWFSPLSGEPFFCQSGQDLFRAWVHAAAIDPPSRGSSLGAARD